MLRSLSYVTDHTGFRGTIKKAPADFVVRELELPQRPAAPRDVSPPNSPTGGPPAASVTASAGAGGMVGPARCDPVAYPEQSRCAGGLKSGPEVAALLDSLLGKPASERLTKFACDLKEAWDSEGGCDTGAGEFSLGAVVDKRDRADLHCAIRQRFPFLVTVTKDNEMVVKGNPDYRELCQLVTEKETSDFFKFLDAKLENSTFSFEPDGNKEHRKIVHHFINKKFGKILETKSFAVADVGCKPNMSIMVRFRGRSCSRKRSADGFQIKQDLYTAFTLQKENLETLEAISFLAAELGVLPSDFSYTGIKDKKAITYQLMVVKKVTPERLKEIESKLEKRGMRIHNIHSAHQHLRLGQLKGNHFDIVVRDLKHHSHDSPVDLRERISEAMENIEKRVKVTRLWFYCPRVTYHSSGDLRSWLAEMLPLALYYVNNDANNLAKGFVNYYGPQRFGQGQNVQTDQIGLALLNEKMVKAVKLFFTPEDTDDPVNNAKRYFLQTEDAKGTLTMLPEFKVREKMLLRALHRYGVNQEGCTKGWLSIPHSMRIFYVHAYCSQIWNEATSYRLKTYGSKVVEGDLVFSEENDESLSLNDKVHVVTALEESANKYSIYQVVLPMVGHSIKYPSNEVGQWYCERLSKDELQMCKFRVPPLQLNVPGCYRHILKHVQNLFYFLEGSEEGSKIEDNHLNESKVSLHISFDLDPSCYATVCLREIMKCDF